MAKALSLRETADEGGGARLLTPGRYVLWSVYRYCGPGAGPAAASGDVPPGRPGPIRGEFASNSVTIEVR